MLSDSEFTVETCGMTLGAILILVEFPAGYAGARLGAWRQVRP